jgi:hypothetical protein
MIANDKELTAMQDRIVHFQRILLQMRVKARAEEFPTMASGYRQEIERMQEEIMEYLTRHATEPVPAKAS